MSGYRGMSVRVNEGPCLRVRYRMKIMLNLVIVPCAPSTLRAQRSCGLLPFLKVGRRRLDGVDRAAQLTKGKPGVERLPT